MIEEANGGKDTIFASAGFKLLATQQIESLTLTGSADINASGNELNNLLTGNAGDNILNGEVGNDTLTGRDGDDLLFGDIGNDVMTGGKGDNRYFVDSVADKVSEAANHGIDTVGSNVANFVLGANFENLQLGSAAGNGTGNSLDNTIDGGGNANKLDGGAGNDTIDGGSGNDTLLGGAGNDDLDGEGGDFDLVDGGAGNDTLTDLSGGDTLKGGAGNDRYVIASASTQIVELANGGTDEIETNGIGFSLAGLTQIENLTLTGAGQLAGIGNDLNNKITGNDDANTLDGGKGNDTLDGGKGTDQLRGGLGNDIYIVDNPGDTVIENSGGGTDTILSAISFTLLGLGVENLTLGGLGDGRGKREGLDNVITGNAGINELKGFGGNDVLIAVAAGAVGDELEGGSGNDTLKGSVGNDQIDGGSGNDVMAGGKGDDDYFVDSVGDKITEGASAGRDEVKSSLANYTLGANVDDLVLIGGRSTAQAMPLPMK